jgi:hypothetical protein
MAPKFSTTIHHLTLVEYCVSSFLQEETIKKVGKDLILLEV